MGRGKFGVEFLDWRPGRVSGRGRWDLDCALIRFDRMLNLFFFLVLEVRDSKKGAVLLDFRAERECA